MNEKNCIICLVCNRSDPRRARVFANRSNKISRVNIGSDLWCQEINPPKYLGTRFSQDRLWRQTKVKDEHFAKTNCFGSRFYFLCLIKLFIINLIVRQEHLLSKGIKDGAFAL